MACGALIRWDECKRCVLFVRIRTDVRILKQVLPCFICANAHGRENLEGGTAKKEGLSLHGNAEFCA